MRAHHFKARYAEKGLLDNPAISDTAISFSCNEELETEEDEEIETKNY